MQQAGCPTPHCCMTRSLAIQRKVGLDREFVYAFYSLGERCHFCRTQSCSYLRDCHDTISCLTVRCIRTSSFTGSSSAFILLKICSSASLRYSGASGAAGDACEYGLRQIVGKLVERGAGCRRVAAAAIVYVLVRMQLRLMCVAGREQCTGVILETMRRQK